MELTLNNVLNRLAEKTVDNTTQLRKGVNQRRNGMTDLYGVPFMASSVSTGTRQAATFYVSISPDIVYYERFAFKLHIQAASDTDDWRVYVGNREVTDYLIAQHEGDWITGTGIFPTDEVDSQSFLQDFYDILDVASLLYAEGEIATAEKILEPELKEIKITSDVAFTVTAYVYTKLSHINR